MKETALIIGFDVPLRTHLSWALGKDGSVIEHSFYDLRFPEVLQIAIGQASRIVMVTTDALMGVTIEHDELDLKIIDSVLNRANEQNCPVIAISSSLSLGRSTQGKKIVPDANWQEDKHWSASAYFHYRIRRKCYRARSEGLDISTLYTAHVSLSDAAPHSMAHRWLALLQEDLVNTTSEVASISITQLASMIEKSAQSHSPRADQLAIDSIKAVSHLVTGVSKGVPTQKDRDRFRMSWIDRISAIFRTRRISPKEEVLQLLRENFEYELGK